MTRHVLIAVLLVACSCKTHRDPQPTSAITIGTPKRDNLQYLAFWVAVGADLFAKHGVRVELVRGTAELPASDRLERGELDAAILPPPRYLDLIARDAPVVVVANLLANDGIALVVQAAVAARLGLTRSLPVAARLRRMHGLRIGVAAGPPTRLRALFASQGLDMDKEVILITLKGDPQNVEFGDGRVDGLYCHSPYLERALLDQGAVMVIDQQAGDVAELANRQIHALVTTRRLIESQPVQLQKLVSAIAEAEALIHRQPEMAVTAILATFPEMDRTHVGKLVEVYAPAVPATPEVSVDGFAKALALYPAQRQAPSLASADLAAHVDNRFAAAARHA